MKYAINKPIIWQKAWATFVALGVLFTLLPSVTLALGTNLGVSLSITNSQGYKTGEGTVARPSETVKVSAEFMNNSDTAVNTTGYKITLPTGLTMVGGTLESYDAGSGYSWGAEACDLLGVGCSDGSLAGYDIVGFRFDATVDASGYTTNPLEIVATMTGADETTVNMNRKVRVAPTVSSVSPDTAVNTNSTPVIISGAGLQNATAVYLITDSTDLVNRADGVTLANNANFTSAGATFVTSGVTAGDFLEITSGPDVGIYQIYDVVNETTLSIDNEGANFPGGRVFGSGTNPVTYEIHKSYPLTGTPTPNASGTQLTGMTVSPGMMNGTYKLIVEQSGLTLPTVYTETGNTVNFTIEEDTAAPEITLVSTSATAIDTAQTSTITWNANETCAYTVRVGGDGADETSGTEITGANPNGNFVSGGGDIASEVLFADLPTEGSNTVWVYCTDLSGNTGSKSVNIARDTVAPTSAATPLGGVYLSAVDVSLKPYVDNTMAEEDTNATVYYTTDGSVPSVTGCPGACAPQGTTAAFVPGTPINVVANTTIKFYAIDSLGHAEDPIKEETYTFDIVPPTFVSAEAINDTTVQLTFDEDIAIIGEASDFTATGLSVQSVAINTDDFTKVDLTVSPINNTAYIAADLAIAESAICDGAANCMAASAGLAISDKQAPKFVSAVFDDNGTPADDTDDLLRATYSEPLSAALGDHDANAFSSSVFTVDGACGTAGVSAVAGSDIDICLATRTAESATDLTITAGAVRDANANLSEAEADREINDAIAPILTLLNPFSDSVGNKEITTNYNLSEEVDPATLKLTFTQTSGAADGNSPHTVTTLLTADAGLNSLTLDGTDLNADGETTTTDKLVHNSVYTVCLDASDLAGNAGTQVCQTNWRYDNAPTDAPVLNLGFTSPTTNNTPTVDWIDVNQDETNYHFQTSVSSTFETVFIDDESLTEDQNSYTYASALSDAVYYTRVRTKDSADNYSNWSNAESFEVDTTNPSDATITAPADGKAVSGNFTITGTASDASVAGLEKVEICIYDTTASTYWDGAAWQASADCTADWTDVNDLADGAYTAWDYNFAGAVVAGNAYTLQAKATDKAGNVFTGAIINITGDTTNPGGSITSHADGDYVSDGNVTLAGTASDNIAVSKVEVRVLRDSDSNYWNATSGAWEAGEVWNSAADTSGAGTYANWETDFDSTGDADGVTYTITVKINDSAIDTANETTLAAITLTKDNTAPETVLTQPTATEYTAAEWVGVTPISGTASDVGAGVNKVQVRIVDSGNNSWDGSAWVAAETWLDATGTNNWTYAYTPDKNDTFNVYARAIDNSKRGNGTGGNVDPTPANVAFTYDTDAPSITAADITAVQEGGNSTITVTFDEDMDNALITNTANWSVTDTDTLGGATDVISVDNVAYDNIVYTATLTVSGMTWQTGETYTVDAGSVTDIAGNATTPATVDIVQSDYTPPTFVSARFISDTQVEVTYDENLNSDTAQHDASRFVSATYFPSGADSVDSVNGATIILNIPSLSGDTAATANDLNILPNAVKDASTATANGNASQETVNNANITDGQLPTIINSSAAASPGDDTVVVIFSEDIDASVSTNIYSGNNTGNYSLESPTSGGLETISNASVNGDTVTLTVTSALVVGETYTLTVAGVADANDTTNTITSEQTSGNVGGGLVISEVVTSPQTDWSGDGNNDEWVELYITASGLDLTSNDFQIEIVDGTDFAGTVNGANPAFSNVQYFGAGTVNNTVAGDRIVLLTPMTTETIDDDAEILVHYQGVLSSDDGDAENDTVTGGTVLDSVKLGGGAGEAPSGASTATYDESVFRNNTVRDTDNDAADFNQGTATFGTIDTTAPVLNTRFPEVNTLMPSGNFTLRGSFTEVGSGMLSKNNFTVFEVDGADEKAAMVYDPATQSFTWSAVGLAPGMHTVRMVVADNADNNAPTMQWNFWVDNPTVQVTRLSALLEPIFPNGDTTNTTEDTLITVTTYGAGVDVKAIQDQLLTNGGNTIEAWGGVQADRGFGWAVTDQTGNNYSAYNGFNAPMTETNVASVAQVNGASLGAMQTYTFYVRYTVNPSNINQPGGDYTNNIAYDVDFSY